MTESDRSAHRLQATDLSRFRRQLDGEHPALIGGPIRTLVWRLIDGQDQAVATALLSDSDIDVSDLLFGLAEYGLWLDPSGHYALARQREQYLCAEIGRTMLPELRTASHPNAEVPQLSESEAADLTIDLVEARIYGREVSSPLAVRMQAALEETYGSLTEGMVDWLEDLALAQWCWRQISTGRGATDLTRALARAAAAPTEEFVRGLPEVSLELRRIAGPARPVPDADHRGAPLRAPGSDVG
jgi:hypothetical protein